MPERSPAMPPTGSWGSPCCRPAGIDRVAPDRRSQARASSRPRPGGHRLPLHRRARGLAEPMALIAIAADKGSPGVTTTSVALAAVWPRPVLLAECDPAGGDIVYRLPGDGGERLDSRRGLLSLAVAARRGLQPHQVWEHVQKLRGGLDVLAGVTSAEHGAGLEALWGPVGAVLAALPQADVIADCGRIGVDGPYYDFLAHAAAVVMITRATLGEVVRLRERVAAVATAVHRRGSPGARAGVVVIADHRHFNSALAEVGQALQQARAPAIVLGGLADEPKSADLLRGEWGGKLDKSLLIRTAREIAAHLAEQLPTDSQPGPAPAERLAAPSRGLGIMADRAAAEAPGLAPAPLPELPDQPEQPAAPAPGLGIMADGPAGQDPGHPAAPRGISRVAHPARTAEQPGAAGRPAEPPAAYPRDPAYPADTAYPADGAHPAAVTDQPAVAYPPGQPLNGYQPGQQETAKPGQVAGFLPAEQRTWPGQDPSGRADPGQRAWPESSDHGWPDSGEDGWPDSGERGRPEAGPGTGPVAAQRERGRRAQRGRHSGTPGAGGDA